MDRSAPSAGRLLILTKARLGARSQARPGGGRKRILATFIDGVEALLGDARRSGLQFTASGQTGVEIEVRETPGTARTPPWTDFWGTLTLTRTQAKDLADELETVIARYRHLKHPKGAGEYVVHAGLVPTPKRKRRSG